MASQPKLPQSEESIKNIKKLSEIRELRAKEVLMAGKPKLLSEEEFIVPSSNGKDSYKVIHLDSWSCSCPDFKHNCQKLGIYCKHIKALQSPHTDIRNIFVDKLSFLSKSHLSQIHEVLVK